MNSLSTRNSNCIIIRIVVNCNINKRFVNFCVPGDHINTRMGKMIVDGYLFLFWYFFKCRGVIYCHQKNCKYRNYCFHYRGSITAEEAEMLLKFLDTLGD